MLLGNKLGQSRLVDTVCALSAPAQGSVWGFEGWLLSAGDEVWAIPRGVRLAVQQLHLQKRVH